MNLRRACEHGHFDEHWDPEKGEWSEAGTVCPGGTEPTTDELLAMLVEDREPMWFCVNGWMEPVMPFRTRPEDCEDPGCGWFYVIPVEQEVTP